MPFTSNRAFKKNPRLFTAAKGMYYTTPDGRQVLDGLSGLWGCKRRTLPSQDRRSRATASRDDGLRTGVPNGASTAIPK